MRPEEWSRALALVAVRQQQHDRGALAPLLLARRDELVDDRLGAVGEVAELRLPGDQGVRADHAVAVLEAHRGELAEQRVVHVELRGVVVERLERGVLLAADPVDQHGVTLAEGAAAGVLTDQADRVVVDEERAEGEQLAGRPVDRVLGDHRAAALDHRRETRVDGEALGQVELGVDDPLDDLLRDRRLGVLVRPRDHLVGLGPHDRARLERLPGGLPGLGEGPFELLLVVAQGLLGLLDRDVAAADEGLGVQLAGRALGVDEVVHQRLRERRVVGLVVAAPPVADQVDDDVLEERLAVFVGQPADPHDRLGVVAVHVEDRRLDHARDVGGVHARPRGGGRGGEADLVVHHDVDGATGAVAAQLGQVQGLGDHALAGERRVAVDEHGQDGEALLAALQQVLLGPDHALQDRVDGLQV